MAACQRRSLRRVARQLREKFFQAAIKPELRRELPEDGSELVFEREDAGSEEVRQRDASVSQLQHVGDVAAALDREREPRRHLGVPRRIRRGPLERIERTVELDGVEALRGEAELTPLQQTWRVKLATPARVSPAGYPDPDPGAASRRSRAAASGHRLRAWRCGAQLASSRSREYAFITS